MDMENQAYIRPEDKIFEFANSRDDSDWKTLLYSLISKENLDPFNIDISILTHKYLEFIKDSQNKTDFNVSGKFLTIAVFLLKTKAEILLEREIRGIDAKFEYVLSEGEINQEEFESLEDLSLEIEEQEIKKAKKKYNLKIRNPLARKRKVNIYDLISSLEKTFEQANRRKENFLMKNSKVEYSGPTYKKNKKDLKEIIEELYRIIVEEFKQKNGHLNFEHLIKKEEKTKSEILGKFLPLLYLHNQNKIEVSQEKHFGEIKIHKINKE